MFIIILDNDLGISSVNPKTISLLTANLPAVTLSVFQSDRDINIDRKSDRCVSNISKKIHQNVSSWTDL